MAFLFNLLSGDTRLTLAATDGQGGTTLWQHDISIALFDVDATAQNGDDFVGRTLQIGTTTGGRHTVLESATIPADGHIRFGGKALIQSMMGNDVNLWFCIPGVVKYFCNGSSAAISSDADKPLYHVALPDKDGGSQLDPERPDNPENTWIVALYMGINQGGQPGGAPLYFASGNLMYEEDGGHYYAYVATQDITEAEGTPDMTGIDSNHRDLFAWNEISDFSTLDGGYLASLGLRLPDREEMNPLVQVVRGEQVPGLSHAAKLDDFGAATFTYSIPAGAVGQAAIENTLLLPYVGGVVPPDSGTPTRGQNGCYWLIGSMPGSYYWFNPNWVMYISSGIHTDKFATVRLVTE